MGDSHTKIKAKDEIPGFGPYIRLWAAGSVNQVGDNQGSSLVEMTVEAGSGGGN